MAQTTNLRGQVSPIPTLTNPNWAGDCLDREYLMPAGSKVDNSAFGAVDTLGRIPIPSGTVVGRTFAQRDAGTALHPAVAADDEVFLTAFDVTDALVNDDVELTRPKSGLVVKENFLPADHSGTAFTALDAAVVAKVRAAYVCVNGVA